jgi:hypothetical protein
MLSTSTTRSRTRKPDEQKNAPELPIGRFLKPKSLGGNRVILVVELNRLAYVLELSGRSHRSCFTRGQCVVMRASVVTSVR